jgi:hypothetical protein
MRLWIRIRYTLTAYLPKSNMFFYNPHTLTRGADEICRLCTK